MRVGVIGLDSSHAVQFSRRIQSLSANGQTICRVTHCWDTDASARASTDAETPLKTLGIERTSALDDLLSAVDAVMVLAVDGHRHFEFAMRTLDRGMPVFVDKPLTCSTAEAARLLEYTRTRQSRCYSASALRFADRTPDLSIDSLGRIVSIEASGPFQDKSSMPGLWYYGCHTFELIDSLWPSPGGLQKIRAERGHAGHRISLAYHDGRSAIIGLDVEGTAPFIACQKGERDSIKYQFDLTLAYGRLVASICSFFEGKRAACPLEAAAETVAAIAAAEASLSLGGVWVRLDQVWSTPGLHPESQPAKKLT